MQNFSERLIERMAQTHETQESLADKLGISASTVSRWQSGSQPRKQTAHNLASILKVTTSWLLTGKGEKKTVTSLLKESQAEAAKMNELDLYRELLDLLRCCAPHLPINVLLEVAEKLQTRPSLECQTLVKDLIALARKKT